MSACVCVWLGEGGRGRRRRFPLAPGVLTAAARLPDQRVRLGSHPRTQCGCARQLTYEFNLLYHRAAPKHGAAAGRAPSPNE